MNTNELSEFRDMLEASTQSADIKDIVGASKVLFVRSQDELALWNSNSKGTKLTAHQAFSLFGAESILEVFRNGSSIIVEDPSEPARTIRLRRENLGWPIEEVAEGLSLTPSEYEQLEDPRRRNPIGKIASAFRYFGLDEDLISQKSIYQQKIAFRLKKVSGDNILNREQIRSSLEAIWLIEKQSKLTKALLGKETLAYQAFGPETDYGNVVHPAYKVGYDLAASLRKVFEYKPTDPIFSIYRFAEEQLDIPVIFLELGEDLAGITVNTDSGYRGILINRNLYYTNAMSMRIAIAHEIEHLLYDSNEMLNSFRIDRISQIDQYTTRDKVEKRANAFSIEFLAPQETVKHLYKTSADIGLVMDRLGVSFSAARQHASNAMSEVQTSEETRFETSTDQIKEKWRSSEATPHEFVTYSGLPLSRSGRFAALVVLAQRRNLIHVEVAAQYLGISVEKYEKNVGLIESLHSNFFKQQTVSGGS